MTQMIHNSSYATAPAMSRSATSGTVVAQYFRFHVLPVSCTSGDVGVRLRVLRLADKRR